MFPNKLKQKNYSKKMCISNKIILYLDSTTSSEDPSLELSESDVSSF